MCHKTAPKQLLQPKKLYHNLCKLSLMQAPNHFCFIKVEGPQSYPDTPKNLSVGLPKPPPAPPRAAQAGNSHNCWDKAKN